MAFKQKEENYEKSSCSNPCPGLHRTLCPLDFSAVLSRSVIFIGFIPIPGLLFGLLIQLIPAILGFVGAGSLWNS